MEHETQIKTAENGLENGSKLSEKQTGYILLRKQGMSIADAAKATAYSLGYAYQLEKKLTGYDLTTEFWLSDATKAL
ncbi:MAG: hypothetical protein V3V45_00615, partial [Candidatus Brocadiales bacterium]